MAAGDLCSLADVKQYLGLDVAGVTSSDALLTRLVSSASAWLTGQIGQPIVSTAFAGEVYSGEGTLFLRPRSAPVISVQSLTIDGNTIAQRDAVTEGWVLQDDILWLSGPSGGGAGIPGPLGPYISPTRMTALRFTNGNGNVVLAYTAGYAAVPADLQQAAVELAAESYLRRDRLGIMSKTIAGEAVTFQTLSLGAGLQGVLDTYRRHRL